MIAKSLVVVTLATLLLSACVRPTPTPAPGEGNANMPNPASVYCEQNGGKVVNRQTAEGEAGVCLFPDGSFCDEWAFFRKECQPGQPTPTVPSAIATMLPARELERWKTFQHEQLGYRFDYPPYASIVNASDPLQSISILGEGGWPQINIAHPSGRVEFRPPAGADLLAWLTAHNMLGENQQPDVQIAGETALHFRHERSPQSFADDRYFFIHDGQLYQIIIGHVDDKEDWAVYTRFLESFQWLAD